MNKLWSLLIPVYFYAITILTKYGFISYFNIPASFIEPTSIKDNTIFFFDFTKSLVDSLGWLYFGLSVVALIFAIFVIFSSGSFLRNFFILIIAPAILFGFYKFGSFWAANETSFYTLSSDCLSIDSSEIYIIPNIYNGKAILVPVDDVTMKMKGSFLVKDAAELDCEIEYREVGQIKK